MACVRPLEMYRALEGGMTTDRRKALNKWRPDKVPCGKCILCKKDRARDWKVRIMAENRPHLNKWSSFFWTLTYDDKHLPSDGGLRREHLRRFFEQVRRDYAGFRFFGCGEYGTSTNRPHYHAIVFGFPMRVAKMDYVDPGTGERTIDPVVGTHGELKVFRGSGEHKDYEQYTAPGLDKYWGHGFVRVGEVTDASAGYVSGYILEKQIGQSLKTAQHYIRNDRVTGRKVSVEREFQVMSRMPGIGRGDFEKYADLMFVHDSVVAGVPGKRFETAVPRYYDKLYERVDMAAFGGVKKRRVAKAKLNAVNTTPERLVAREKIELQRFNEAKRRKSL